MLGILWSLYSHCNIGRKLFELHKIQAFWWHASIQVDTTVFPNLSDKHTCTRRVTSVTSSAVNALESNKKAVRLFYGLFHHLSKHPCANALSIHTYTLEHSPHESRSAQFSRNVIYKCMRKIWRFRRRIDGATFPAHITFQAFFIKERACTRRDERCCWEYSWATRVTLTPLRLHLLRALRANAQSDLGSTENATNTFTWGFDSLASTNETKTWNSNKPIISTVLILTISI